MTDETHVQQEEALAQAEGVKAPQSSEEVLAALRAERDEAIDRWKRAAADFDNFRKRALREREEFATLANERLVKELLPVLDDLDRTIDHTVASSASGTELEHLLAGVEMVRTRILNVFSKEGVEVIDPFGAAFDPHRDQAVGEREDAEVPEHTVVEVYQKGYGLGGRIIRPATVIVSVGGPAQPA